MSQDDQPGADGPQAGSEDYAGSPRPDAVMPILDEWQLAALRAIGREWDQVTADPRVWREVLPVDPAVGGYPKDSDFRPARFTRVVAVSGRDRRRPQPPRQLGTIRIRQLHGNSQRHEQSYREVKLFHSRDTRTCSSAGLPPRLWPAG